MIRKTTELKVHIAGIKLKENLDLGGICTTSQ